MRDHALISFSRPIGHVLGLILLFLTPTACNAHPAEVQEQRPAASTAPDRRANGNAVSHWNTLAVRLMVDPGPVIDSRAFTIMHAAIHDAVNGVERRFEPYTAKLSDPEASVDAAVASAAREVMMTLSPSTTAQIEEAYAAALAVIPDGAAKSKGVRLGRRAARANLKRRADDGVPVGPWPPRSGPITEPVYVPSGEPGDYAFTPPFDRPPLGPAALLPGWGRLEPFGADLSEHRLPGPDPLDSEAYARDVNHLQSIGSLHSETRSPDQTEIAFFWFEDFHTWNEIARTILEREGSDEWRSARTFLLLNMAMTDAGIACFEAKYRFRFWRPITAIRRADEDGNPATEPDREWRPLLWTSPEIVPPTFFTPPIPDYPSAAATVSAAAASVLAATFGDRQEFEATSVFLPDVTRRFTSFSQAAEENGMSRAYGGIHFLRAVRDGAELGRSVGRQVSELLPSTRR